jgi:glycosyltransferase involved in cell wall biosynthesis
MHIGIDGNEANQPIRVGVGQYAYNLLSQLSQLSRPHHHYTIYLKSPPEKDLPPVSPTWKYVIFGPSKLWTKFALPLHLWCQSPKPDLFYTPSHYSPSFSPITTIPTIHDLGYLDSQDQFTQKDLYQLINWTKESIARAKHLVAVSEFTKSEIQRIYHINPNQISVIPNGVGDIAPITPIQKQAVINKFQLPAKYFLYLGTLKPNKNIPFLIKSFSLFRQTHPQHSPLKLVIVGKKGWLFEDIFQVVQQQNLQNQVIFTDYVSQSEKWAIMSGAQAFIIPSTYEGFGIPAIEAMKMNIPVIASNIPAFKEVAQKAALYIDPADPQTLVEAMVKILTPTVRQQLIQNGVIRAQKYTWSASAQKLLNLFDRFSS